MYGSSTELEFDDSLLSTSSILGTTWVWDATKENCVRVNDAGVVMEVWEYSPKQPIPPCQSNVVWSTRKLVGYVFLGVAIAGVLAYASMRT